ncbi:hypothetical protein EC957_006754 [Mortierella hygrophila]|uniref:Uncharacterized protein n=1 Tax=Mortierella hygrophila TaxID=979708 RepID=A0A9P6EZD9_9FUNG|nr:hypothetical protein EC957_006754 [Mortierella hygrophila]
MSPQVKSGKDFDEALSTKRNHAPLYEPQHLPPPPPAPRLSLPALGSFTTPPSTTATIPHDTPSSSPSFNTNITAATSTTTSSTTSSLDYDDSYTAFYSSIPTVADSLYTAIIPTTPTSSTAATTTSTTTPALTPTTANSNNPYLHYPYSTSFTASAEYQYHASLGSKTPMQVVAISNHKLNSDIYSTRSLSIHRRILVKNLLTLIYEMNPMLDWFDDSSSGYDVGMYEDAEDDVSSSSEPLLAEEEQNGWIEQTLNAAGLSDDDDEKIVNKMKKHGRSDTAKTTTPTTTTTKSNSTKSADGRGSVGSSNSNINSDSKMNKKNDTAAQGSGVDQSTPSIKNVSKSTTTPPRPPTRPTQNSGSSSPSISSVLPSFPPAPTNRAHSPPNFPAASTQKPSSQAPSSRAVPSQPRTTYTLSPPSSSSSASSTTSSSSNVSYTSSSSSGSSLLISGGGAAPLPRPKSIELPQSLNNYLSTVFDVDWSVELPTMEDSLFTFKGPSSSPSPPSLGTLSPPGTLSHMNGSLLSSAPKRRSFSSSTSTISSSSFSTLSKHSTTSSSSSLSSVDSWNKSPPFVATETTTTTTPRGMVTSGEIMVAKSVQQHYHGNIHASSVTRGASTSGATTTGPAKPLPPIRQDMQQRTSGDAGPVPIKGGAVPRAGDGHNTLKVNTTAYNNNNINNNNSNNRQPAVNTGTSPSKQVTRKSTLVPGRRSSLMHTGQMPLASGTRKAPTSGPVAIPSSNPTPTTVTITKINTSSMGSTTPTNSSASPTSPPPQPNTSFANGYVPPSCSNNGSGGGGAHGGHQQPGFGPVSGPGGSVSPSIARMTSSLQPMERPALGQRNPSTENVASSAGLPRPLLAKSFSSPIVIGQGGATTSQPLPASLPAAPSSGTNAAGGNGYYDSHHHYDHQSNGFSAGGFPVVSSRGHSQAPRKLAVLPPVSPPRGPSNTSNFMPITPPRSPSRGTATTASVPPYVLMPAPALSPLPSCGPLASGAPVLPPLFPVQGEDRKSLSGSPTSPYSRRSPPPSSPSSPTNGAVSYKYQQHHPQQQQQKQQQYLATPHVYTRSTSDDQIHSRCATAAPTRSSSPSPPLSSTSPSLTGSSTSSTATSLSQGSQALHPTTTTTSTTARSAASYGMKASKSTPDLTTGLTSEWYFVNAPGQTSAESLTQRPLPSLPQLYQPYSQQQHQKQQSYTYQPQPQSHQHPQRQQSYSYGGPDKVSRSGSGYKTGMTSAPLPLPRITMSPPVAGPSSSQISGSGGSNRWATMKTMFSLKTTTGHGGK